jgi:hypothetical protein
MTSGINLDQGDGIQVVISLFNVAQNLRDRGEWIRAVSGENGGRPG